jgi:hypothetical protein
MLIYPGRFLRHCFFSYIIATFFFPEWIFRDPRRYR